MNIDDMEGLDEEARKEIEEFQKVTREEDGDQDYAKSQYSIGKICATKNFLLEAKKAWANIQKNDDPEIYNKALYSQGLASAMLEDRTQAIFFWNKVKRKWGKETFVDSKFNLGTVYAQMENYDEALKAWDKIKKTDDFKTYIDLQIHIGVAYYKKGDVDRAISILESVDLKDGLEVYAEAQLRLGIICYKLNLIEKSIRYFSRVKREYSPVVFSSAAFHLGLTILEKRQEVDSALNAWHSIIREDDSTFYAEAQFNIGIVHLELGKKEDALNILGNIRIEDNEEAYSKAQLHIADLYASQNDTDTAIKFWKNIKLQYSYEHYLTAKRNIGMCYFKKGEINKAVSIWKELSGSVKFGEYSFKIDCFRKINDLFKLDINSEIGNGFLISFMLVLDIYSKYLDSITKAPERKFAHYTSTYVTDLLLKHDYKDHSCKLGSKFRLNTINNVNDPSEGLVLSNYLTQGNINTLKFEKNNQVFVSCFTFNHDSLNQFRLYGKENNKEASGVSLIFKNSYFRTDYYNEVSNFELPRRLNDSLEVKNNSKDNSFLSKQILLRCVYLEPNSGYIRLAQRDKLTFYREFSDKQDAQQRWETYQKEIDSKTDKVQSLLTDLKNSYLGITNAKNQTLEENPKLGKDLEVLRDEILLPLKYLIKNSAFQEEQECRMMYITTIDNSKVQMVYGQALYIEYETDIKDNLDKIYIAPAATQYQPYLAKLLCDTDVKIELSNNPYRQTS
ncbi:DUF2971 domain-containing protein [Psychrobacter sp. APC 3281]|uniref:tetratricopeptide repeat protein n=1 Tax=Psychrobacter sp. APC 3281 TaxID=3035190 RepID=UPI0025B5B2D1|nr:DUF2971 domain-containing protein [Psychrobacter sp. APC 3281]MDN3447299.1 DUF2971 domain-containing protein [Psychrobacter sp. APC 3281]